jgi:hypothetical protein
MSTAGYKRLFLFRPRLKIRPRKQKTAQNVKKTLRQKIAQNITQSVRQKIAQDVKKSPHTKK